MIPFFRMVFLITLLLTLPTIISSFIVPSSTTEFLTNSRTILKLTKPRSNNEIPTIRNWTVDNQTGAILGNVYGSPKSKDGEEITTSTITNLKPSKVQENDVIITLSGSKYLLGSPAEEQRYKASSIFASFTSMILQKQSSSGRRKPESPFDSMPKGGKARPKPFAGVKLQRPKKNEEQIPILDDWYVDRRTEELCGIISNSPITYENDGDLVTTAEVATNLAFVVEGFTVLTVDGRKYKLGTPKKGSNGSFRIIVDDMKKTLVGSNDIDEINPWNTPTLNEWDVQETAQGEVYVVGIIQGTNDPDVPNGELITTDEVITSLEYLDEGFSIVTSTGETYKLGRRDGVGKRRRKAADNNIGLKNMIPEIPDRSSGSSGTYALVEPEVLRPKISTTSIATMNRGDKKKKPVLENWTSDDNGRVTGTISNGNNRNNGKIITTTQSINPSVLHKTGSIVYDDEGIAYELGSEGGMSITAIDDWFFTIGGGICGTVSRTSNPATAQVGDTLTTSKIMTVDIREGKVVETINGSIYELGSKRIEEGVFYNTSQQSTKETRIGNGILATIGRLFKTTLGKGAL